MRRTPARAAVRTGGLVAALVALLGAAGQARFDLQGHRGARGLHPENTLEGFLEALAIGVTTLEMDVGMTRDGVMVVHHDVALHPDVARGPDGAWVGRPTPMLHELDFEQLSALDVGRLRPGSAYAKRFPEQRGRDGVRIPRLSDVIAAAERRSGRAIRYNVETKLNPEAPGATADPVVLADAVVAELRATGVECRALVQSFDWRTLRRVRETAPEIATACLSSEQESEDTIRRGAPGPSPWTSGLDVDGFQGSVPRMVHAAGCAVWSPNLGDIDAGAVADAHALALRVVPWTVNEPGEMKALLAIGVDGLITDRPDLARAVLAEAARPLPPVFAVEP